MKNFKKLYRKGGTNGIEIFTRFQCNYWVSGYYVVQRTISLCKQRKIKLPDAIVAATALSENMVLVTRNTWDFKNIDGLVLLNPWEE